MRDCNLPYISGRFSKVFFKLNAFLQEKIKKNRCCFHFQSFRHSQPLPTGFFDLPKFLLKHRIEEYPRVKGLKLLIPKRYRPYCSQLIKNFKFPLLSNRAIMFRRHVKWQFYKTHIDIKLKTLNKLVVSTAGVWLLLKKTFLPIY